MSIKVSIITNIPTPYRKNQFSLLKSKLPDLKVFYIKDDLEDREWKVKNEDFYFYLKKLIDIPGFGVLNKNLISLVRDADILIIGGYDQPSYIYLAFMAILLDKPYLLLFDGIAPSRLQDNDRNLKTTLKRYIAKHASYIIANGTVGKLYCTDVLKVSDNKVYNQYLSIDNHLFSNFLDEKENIKHKLKLKYHIESDSKIILYSGRFIERKKILDLIQAIALLPNSDKYVLLLLGSGEQTEVLKKSIEEYRIHAIFPGFIDQEKLYEYYFLSDVLVLPSQNEPWGLVVNEALASEIPVVLSNDVGASLDMVEEGVNGYIFDVGDIKSLSDKIKKAIDLPSEGIQTFSNKLLKKWNIENSVDVISEAVHLATKSKDLKSVIITNIPSPYRLPLWRSLCQLVNLSVICISETERNRHWNVVLDRHIIILKSAHIFFSRLDWGLHFTIPFALTQKLIKTSPDVVIIAGYDNMQHWEALLYAKIFGKKTVFWNGSTLLSSRSNNKAINFLKSFFIKSVDAYYTYGTKATEYLIHHGANPDNVITGTNTVDTDYFKENTSDSSLDDGNVKFLYVGQLLERKGLENTLQAFRSLKQTNWTLTIIGTGPDERKLKKIVTDFTLEKNIFFEGYKQKEEILKYFSDSNILIMPSYLEVWGLVINEALASGLFCLSSKYAGATFDLIDEDKNGLIIDPLDINSFVNDLQRCFDLQLDKREIKTSFTIAPNSEAIKIYNSIQKALNV